MDKLKEHWESSGIMEWHKRQFLTPKRNLVYFEQFVTRYQDLNNQRVLVLACGG